MKRWVTAALLSGALALTACEAEPAAPAEPAEPPSSAPTSSEPTSTAPTTEPTGPVEPTLPPEAEANTKAGAEAFAKFYWEVVNYAQSSGDTAALAKIQDRECDFCRGGTEWIDDVHSRGGMITGGDYIAVRADAVPAPDNSDSWLVAVELEVTPQRVTGAGDLNRRSEGSRQSAGILVRPTAQGWRVASIQDM